MMMAALLRLYNSIEQGDIVALKGSLKCSHDYLDVNQILPSHGVGLLHLAVGIELPEPSVQCTELILKNGGDPNTRSEEGLTPVHIAANQGRLDNLKVLLAWGGDISAQDADQKTPYDYAVEEGHWDICDYLLNIAADDLDDSGKEPSYTLALEKILVTTGNIVAEYGELDEEKKQSINDCRKSQMVRDWCDYNMQLCDTRCTIYHNHSMLLDKSVPWNSKLEFTHSRNFSNSQLENTSEDDNSISTSMDYGAERNILLETIISKELSGIDKIEFSHNADNAVYSCLYSDDEKIINSSRVDVRRHSLFENFSLPGSPTNIVHKNYSNKSRIKNNEPDEVASSNLTDDELSIKNILNRDIDDVIEIKDESMIMKSCMNENYPDKNRVSFDLIDDEIKIKNKCKIYLDNVVEIEDESNIMTDDEDVTIDRVENRISLIKVTDKCASVGSVQEEHRYTDVRRDVVLLEKRLLVQNIELPLELVEDGSCSDGKSSVASSLPASVDYDPATLRLELTQCGYNPGPINHSTKRLYLKKLRNLKRNPIVVQNAAGKTYSVELQKTLSDSGLCGAEWREAGGALERAAAADFARRGPVWREGAARTSFTYLLLDPRITRNLPTRAQHQPAKLVWQTFVESIFYVGKGKRSRPYSHLYQAIALWKKDISTSQGNDKKVQHILDVWKSGSGVVCLHVFQNVIPAEAYTYEAAMIDVLGLTNLKNLKTGNYYGVVSSWPLKDRRKLGLFLLYKAMQIFLSEGERQLRPEDLD